MAGYFKTDCRGQYRGIIMASIFDNNVSLLFGKYGQKKIGGVVIDAFVEERHTMSAQITQYPVEEGFNISEHVTHNPDGLTLHCFVGPQPVKILGGILNITSLKNQAYQVYEALVVLKEMSDPIEVITGLRVYDNMIIDSINITRNKDNGQSLEFDIGFSQIIIVQSLETDIPANKQARRKANSKVNKGYSNTEMRRKTMTGDTSGGYVIK